MTLNTSSLEKLLKLRGEDGEEKDIPVIHMPFYANTFPLVYGYYTELENLLDADYYTKLKELNGNKKTALIDKKIRVEEWGNKMPRLDTNARYNIFFANQDQIKRWKGRESFYYAHIFEYKHKFVLVEKDKLNTLPSSWGVNCLSVLCDKLSVSDYEEIRIVSDIIPEAEKLRQKVISLINKTFNPDKFEIRKISVVDSKKRSLTDLFKKSDNVFKIYLFGTPLCEILKEDKKQYEKIDYNSDVENTYLCVFSPTPETAFLPFFFIYKFFQENNYNNNVQLDDVAKKFLKQAESNFPAKDEDNFITAFNKSIENHCKLMSPFEIDYK